MRPAMFGKFESEAVYYRERPARRLGVILSTLFLLSLAAVASITSMRASNRAQDGAPVASVALPAAATH
jgi:hypothetical protein